MAPITINEITIDPVADGPVLRAFSLEARDASKSNYVLVQVTNHNGVLTQGERDQLAGLGLVNHGYIADRTYLYGFKGEDLEAVRALDFVEWANVYMKELKVHPTLRKNELGTTSGQNRFLLPALVAPTSNSKFTETVDLVLHEGINAESDDLLNEICAAAHVRRQDLTVTTRKIRLGVQARYLSDLAAVDDVRVILSVGTAQLGNDVARTIMNATVTVNGTPYRGEGQVVCAADTGFDKGSADPSVAHPAFGSRVANLYSLGRPTTGVTDDPDGHGTHVCGSVLGNGTSTALGTTTTVQGSAPESSLVVQSLYVNSSATVGGIPADLKTLFEPPYKNDSARVHTNSWYYPIPFNGGAQLGYGHNSDAFEIDEFVWKNQDMVICLCAGNDGTDAGNNDGICDFGQVGATAAAKNCVVVGASESVRSQKLLKPSAPTYGTLSSSNFSANPLRDDFVASSAEGMAAFSSRGPTKEGRYKPDVVAPGTSILSTHSRAAPLAGQTFGTSNDPDWFFDSGTSMATPLVAGCCAVIRETLVKNGTPTPSAALIKALLINGATDLTGQYSPTEATPAPNNDFGFGRVNLAASIIIPGPNKDAEFGDRPPLSQGDDTVIIDVDIPKEPPKKPGNDDEASSGDEQPRRPTFKVTLVWTDPPEINGMLQNDLDLVVLSKEPGVGVVERHGNMGTSMGFDNVNNVEQVHWQNIAPGSARIEVRPTAIRNGSQPWAYAWRLTWP